MVFDVLLVLDICLDISEVVFDYSFSDVLGFNIFMGMIDDMSKLILFEGYFEMLVDGDLVK